MTRLYRLLTAFSHALAGAKHSGRAGASCLLGLLLAGAYPAGARPPRRYPVAGQEQPVALLTVGKATYLVTEHSVFRQEGRTFVRHYQSAAPISRAVGADSLLWLGTEQGLVRLGTRQWRARPLALPEAGAAPTPITALFHDAAGALWVGATGQGVYQIVGGELQNRLRIPAVNAGLATADSSVWIATNIGLYRWQHQAWLRYNEEGVTNHEIPDNIVENLLLDATGSLWVLMAGAISVFEPAAQAGSGESHVPTITYLGRPGNEVYSVAVVPAQGHVFATAMGLLLLPPQPHGELAHVEASADQVQTPQLLVPLTQLGLPTPGPRLVQVDAQQRVWLVSPGEVQVWRAQDFRHATLPAPQLAAKVGGPR
ncbi:hypothetical protein [Hymenobacter bucti]|uniref:Histidine kinase n=1 Tax=Hymenobacter bucti TaxID=1844114 RepID=A0ABW4QTZ1_9BACT